MSRKAYEDACTRAELFGQPVPNKEEFLEKNKHLDVIEFDEVEIKTAENTAILDDQLKGGTSGLAELNTILNSTQTKINRLKGVCGSITNFFRVKVSSKDNLSYSTEPSYVGQTNYDKDYIPPATKIGSINEGLGPEDDEMTPRVAKSKQNGGGVQNGGVLNGSGVQNGGNINNAVDDLRKMQELEDTPLISKATVCDVSKQMTSQMSKLDRMICQADRAQASLKHQNKQMRSILR